MALEFEYICKNINSLSAIPVRHYENNNLIGFYSIIKLIKDPANLYLDKLLSTEKNIEYTFIDASQIYGIIKHESHRIVIGPIGPFLEDRKKIEEVAFLLDIDKDNIEQFASSLSIIPDMPLSSFLQMLCTLNFYLNNEKLSIKDITISDGEQENITSSISPRYIIQDEEDLSERGSKHNFLGYEQNMLLLVEKGSVSELKKYLSEASPGTVGKVAPNHLRNQKNLFISTATVVSRAAIKGGLEQSEAFTMSDNYIQRAEMLFDTNALLNLSYHMVLEYAEKVKGIREDKNLSKPVAEGINYIKKNVVKIKSTDEVSSFVNLSRSHFANLFRKETGKTIAEYITLEKIEEAKRLLRLSDKPLISIADYLGFSSQSHFQNVFKKTTSMTPNQYRKKQY